MDRSYRVAIVGATGAVGTTMRQILEERAFPVASLKLLASHRSAGEILTFKDQPIVVEELTHDSFDDVDLVFSSAGASVSREFIPTAVKKECLVIDNTSAFRMDADTPLVIPEVNMQAAMRHQGLISNPNCSTIQMLVALKPLYDEAGLKRIVVSTYQSVSGKSGSAVIELVDQTTAALEGRPITCDQFPHQMAFNVAFDWPFADNGYSEEEMKMVRKHKKSLKMIPLVSPRQLFGCRCSSPIRNQLTFRRTASSPLMKRVGFFLKPAVLLLLMTRKVGIIRWLSTLQDKMMCMSDVSVRTTLLKTG